MAMFDTDHFESNHSVYRGYNPAFVRKVWAKRRAKALEDAKRARQHAIDNEAEQRERLALEAMERAAERERERERSKARALAAKAKAERDLLEAQKRKADEEQRAEQQITGQIEAAYDAVISKQKREADAARRRLERILAAENRARIAGHTVPAIMKRACRVFRIRMSDLTGRSRRQKFVVARQFVAYWAIRLTPLSYPVIGRMMGGRDHTTILHSRNAYIDKRAFYGRTLPDKRHSASALIPNWQKKPR